jgi:uroporphyrinogen-III synthase
MRVLVTRAQGAAERTAEKLRARGHEAVLAPVLRIARTGEAPPPGSFDAIILTSATAAPSLAFLAAAAERVPIFAVGERTAAAAAALRHDVRMADGDAASLAGLVSRTMPRATKLLHIAGVNRKPEPEAALLALGFSVATWVAYEAIAAERLPEAALHALHGEGLDAALHYSRRSARLVLDLVHHAGATAPFLALAQVCLSADTAAPLRAGGARSVTIAAHPDESSLLAALDQCAEKCGRAGSRATPLR